MSEFPTMNPSLETERESRTVPFQCKICLEIDSVRDLKQDSNRFNIRTLLLSWNSSNKSGLLIPLINSQNLDDETKSSSLPIFTVCLSVAQLLVFLLPCFSMRGSSLTQLQSSYLVFNPTKRNEIWRFITYMFVHVGNFHFIVNIMTQIFLGASLEIVHGWWRVMTIYLSGILAGSLGTSIMIPGVFLSGSSSGNYALVSAHIVATILNYKNLSWPRARLVLGIGYLLGEIITFWYRKLVQDLLHQLPVSYPAHVGGAVAGILVGFVVLKSFESRKLLKWIRMTNAIIYCISIAGIIWFSIAMPNHFETGLLRSIILRQQPCDPLPTAL